jgi:hypothetical protein
MDRTMIALHKIKSFFNLLFAVKHLAIYIFLLTGKLMEPGLENENNLEKVGKKRSSSSLDAARNETFKCIYCKKSFKRFQISKHMYHYHRKVAIHCKSGSCCTYFWTIKERDQHVKKVHQDSKSMTCVYCNKIMCDHGSMWNHMKTHKNAIRCIYRLCATYFLTEDERQEHLKQVHMQEGNWKCIYCSVCVKSISVIGHIKNLHLDVAIQCNFSQRCNKYFLTASERDDHVQKVHLTSKPKKKHKCIYCKKYVSVLTEHIHRMHAKESIKCKVIKCGAYFKTNAELEEHFDKVHREQLNNLKILCPKCDYKTSDKTCFNQHFQMSHGNKQMFCDMCSNGTIYKSKFALKHHFQVAHRKKKQCPHCNSLCKKLVDHLKSQICSICKQKMECVGLMKSHRLICKKRRK